LAVGDIIVEFEGSPVATLDTLHKYLREEVIGRKINLGILRGGYRQVVMVVPGEQG